MQILNAMIVDSHSDLRSGIQSALKKHGIQSMSFDKIGSMIKYINQSGEYPELIVTCTETENNSVLTILAMILKKHEMRHTMVSLIYSSEEDWYLPIAFELGLLSAHQKPMNQLKMEKEFDRLKELLDNPDHGRTLTAYHYLRDHLSRYSVYFSSWF